MQIMSTKQLLDHGIECTGQKGCLRLVQIDALHEGVLIIASDRSYSLLDAFANIRHEYLRPEQDSPNIEPIS
jgi:hypothetical protein